MPDECVCPDRPAADRLNGDRRMPFYGLLKISKQTAVLVCMGEKATSDSETGTELKEEALLMSLA
jgi:hypothetical protein